jgi:N,N'-diacetyllegionaminate synthase
MEKKVYIIAEAGVNHNGSLESAKELVGVAAEAGADAVKFQTFSAENLVCKSAPKAEYQKKTTEAEESQFNMIKRLELDVESHKELIEYCQLKNIQFLSSPFDLPSINLLEELSLPLFKIPSGEITNLPYLRYIGSIGKPVIMSTGMASLGEVEATIDVLLKSGLSIEHITILHCNTEYPSEMQDVNLNAMKTLVSAFPGVTVGLSDHTLGIEASIAAVAMGAKVIEKHFTLDKNLKGPDHMASLDPDELKAMIKAIRNIEKALGDGYKRPNACELKNRLVVRKSIITSSPITKGEIYSEKNLTVKRPGTGINPMHWEEVIGKIANRDYKKDELIEK